MKKAAYEGGSYLWDTLSQTLICVRVVDVVIVEDVLVLFHVLIVRPVHLVHGVLLFWVYPVHAPLDELGQVKGVAFLIRFRRVPVIGVVLQVVLGRVERGQAP